MFYLFLQNELWPQVASSYCYDDYMNITGPQKEPTTTGDLAIYILGHFRHVGNRGKFIYLWSTCTYWQYG